MTMEDEDDLGPPQTIADLAVEQAVDHVVGIMERLPPADRDEALERLATAFRGMRAPTTDDTPRDRGRIIELLSHLKRSVAEGDSHSAWAYRALLSSSLVDAGSPSTADEIRRMVERADSLLSQVYAVLESDQADLRAAIDAWHQDYHPLRAKGDGSTPLQTIHDMLSKIPLDDLAVEHVGLMEGLLDGSVSVEYATAFNA